MLTSRENQIMQVNKHHLQQLNCLQTNLALIFLLFLFSLLILFFLHLALIARASLLKQDVLMGYPENTKTAQGPDKASKATGYMQVRLPPPSQPWPELQLLPCLSCPCLSFLPVKWQRLTKQKSGTRQRVDDFTHHNTSLLLLILSGISNHPSVDHLRAVSHDLQNIIRLEQKVKNRWRPDQLDEVLALQLKKCSSRERAPDLENNHVKKGFHFFFHHPSPK